MAPPVAAAAAPSAAALIPAGISAITSLFSGSSANRQQERMSRRADRYQREQDAFARENFAKTDENYQPYREGGMDAYNQQQNLLGLNGVDQQEQSYQDYRESPGVAWQREQGMRSIEGSSSLSGKGGGSRLEAISRFNQGLSEQGFNDYYNRLNAGTNRGMEALNATEAARGNLTNQGQNVANQRGIIANNIGDDQARRTNSLQDNLNSALQTGVDLYNRFNPQQPPQQPTPPTYSA